MSFVQGLLHGRSNECSFSCPCKGTTLSWSIWAAAQYGDLLSVVNKITLRPEVATLEHEYGYTPLHFAAQHGHVAVVEYLLAKGANVNANACGANPLHRAGQYECVSLLIKHGAEVNNRDTSFGDFNNPLHKAMAGNHKHIYDLLVAHGAHPNICNAKGEDAVWDRSFGCYSEVNSPQTIVGEANNTDFKPCDTSALMAGQDSGQEITDVVPLCSLCSEPGLSFTKTNSGSLLCSICIKKNRFLKLM